MTLPSLSEQITHFVPLCCLDLTMDPACQRFGTVTLSTGRNLAALSYTSCPCMTFSVLLEDHSPRMRADDFQGGEPVSETH